MPQGAGTRASRSRLSQAAPIRIDANFHRPTFFILLIRRMP
jgi:hypothetical protein